jgi:hypothetical protein
MKMRQIKMLKYYPLKTLIQFKPSNESAQDYRFFIFIRDTLLQKQTKTKPKNAQDTVLV